MGDCFLRAGETTQWRTDRWGGGSAEEGSLAYRVHDSFLAQHGHVRKVDVGFPEKIRLNGVESL